MTAAEFKNAFAIADNTSLDLSGEDISIFDGYGLPEFKPVVATLRQVARLMRWQAMYIATKPGESRWDAEELTSIRDLFRKRVTVAG